MSQIEDKSFKVLLGFRANAEMFINTFKADIAKSNVHIKECEMKYSKIAIKQYVNDNPDTDVVIVMEYLEQSKPFTINDFTEIHERYEKIKIIVVLENSKKGTSYMKELLNIGIFNALFAEDSSYENIANLMKKGRTRKEARIYYGTNDSMTDSTGADIEQCIKHIMSAKTNEELKNHALYIKEAVSEREFNIILQRIDENTKAILKQFEEFEQFLWSDVTTKKINTSRKSVISKGSLINITRPAKKEVVEKIVVEKVVVQQKVNLSEIIINTIVGFAGIKARVGNTHQLLTAAYYLSNNDYKVAVVEVADYANSTFDEIKDYFELDSDGSYFTYNGVDFFSEYKLDDLNSLINGIYNFILIDYGVYHEKIRQEFERCAIQVITGSYSEWEKESIVTFIDKVISLNIGVNYNYLLQNVPKDRYMIFQEAYKDIIKVYFSEMGNPFSESGNLGLRQIFKGYITKDSEEKEKRKRIQLPFFKIVNKKENKKTKLKSEPRKVEPMPKRGKIALRGKGVAFITSLKPGVGCTYFSIASANYLDNEDMGDVSISTDCKAAAVIEDSLNKSVQYVHNRNNLDVINLSYDFLIIDSGPLNLLKDEELRELRRADYKIMLCDADDTYLSNLSNFIRSLGSQAKDWHFVFNRLTKTKEKEVRKLMINYKTYFISTFEMSEIRKKQINYEFAELYKKG